MFRMPSLIPVRRRRGAGLVDMTLALAVLSVVIAGAARIATDFVSRNAVQTAAGQLSRLADDVAAWAEAEYAFLQPRVAATSDRIEEHGWTNLIAAGSVSQDRVPTTALHQQVRVFLHAPAGGDLNVVLLTDSPPGGSVRHVPQPGRETRLVGRVDAHTPNELRGWAFAYDLTEISGFAGVGFTGELGAVRQVSNLLHVSPYLHRLPVPGRPELNRLEAPLEMNGHDIVGIGSIEADGGLDIIGDVTVSGEFMADSLNIAGALEIEETLTADSARIEGELTVSSLVADMLAAPEATITEAEVATLTVNGTAEITTMVIGDTLSATSLSLDSVALTHIDIDGTLEADSVIADRVATTSCTGC
ncbi:MAG: hypothetical protein OXF56_24695 [Rhodobacteraceae bacterium]|nr:hypothetical protein [Paracoccaceae bacterium]